MKSIDDNWMRNTRLNKDYKRKKFVFEIAKISFVKYPWPPFLDFGILVAPLSQPRNFGGPSEYLPAPYPALIMTDPLEIFFV